MILGMTPLTFVHVVLSLLGILSGFVVMGAMFAGKRVNSWTKFFLVTTILTSVTGYFFPFHKLLPSHIFGAISLVLLPVAVYARYSKNLVGPWSRIFAATAGISQYLNVFVLVAQLFDKVPALHSLAPTPAAAAFKETQGAVLVVFAILIAVTTKKFRSDLIERQ